MSAVDRFRDLFELDEDAGVLRWKSLSSPRSHRVKVGGLVGSLNRNGYLQTEIGGRCHLVHRVIFLLVNGWLPEQVDHINGNKRDNRPANLRAATNAENARNRGISAANKSGVKGVCWKASSRKWVAYCRVDRRLRHLGYFNELAAAEAAVRAAREELHGRFARHE